MGLIVLAASARGAQTGGRSPFFQSALFGFGAHGFGHLALTALHRGYTPGVATAPTVVIPYSLWAWRELGRAGVRRDGSRACGGADDPGGAGGGARRRAADHPVAENRLISSECGVKFPAAHSDEGDSVAAPVDPSNVEQLRAWDGNQGDLWTARAERFDEGVAGYQRKLLDAAEIDRASKVLDIGCGSGQTARDAARRAADGSVLGVDLSSRMIELARELAAREELSNVAFEQVDAQVHDFPEAHFDVAVSRHGVMFFGDPLAAFRNIARAVRPGGRLALLTWQPVERIEWIVAFRTLLTGEVPKPPSSGPNPWSLSDPDVVRELLTAAGFTDVQLTGLAEPMYFGRDVDDACDFVTDQHASLLDDLTADEKARAIADLRANLAEHQTERGVYYDSAAWLVEARRS